MKKLILVLAIIFVSYGNANANTEIDVDPDDPTEFTKAVKSNTRAFFAESLGNPKLDVLDLKAISESAKKAKDLGVKIFTLGVGSDKGSPIPIRTNGVIESYKKNRNNEVVITKRNADILNEIASLTDGKYTNANDTQIVLDFIKTELKEIDKMEFEAKNKKRHGNWISYQPSGKKSAMGTYQSDLKIGQWFFWNQDDLIEVIYEKNKIVNVLEWNNSDKKLIAKNN